MATTLPDRREPAAMARHGRSWRAAARVLTILVVIAATIAGGAWFGRIGWPRTTAGLLRRVQQT